ncbi:phage tail terminator-like protein [Aureimonas sp. AU22]|uniref:phage tail terminator-like protein n=1 Tax=Aureimonas sp. AU22 TaxID=1638162 RepID=UPI00078450A1|nr:phage tail terminator-like protein [Aureimonas sp. AU22]
MAHPSVISAVEARLRGSFDRCPIVTENVSSSMPDDGGPWLLLDFPWSRSQWQSDDEFLEEGGFRLRLHIKAGRSTDEGRGWLEDLTTLFRGTAFDGVQCYAPQSPASDDRNEVAGYFRLEITVPYATVIIG